MPWYKEVSRQEWKTFLTTFAAWTLDAFDFTIITFVLTDIRRSFEVNLALAGALATVTLFFRMIGGIGAGTLADRYGRKGPILFAIAWYTGFAFLSGLSTSYVMLFTFRGLFGIGMGGMWAAGMPLALEQWPAKHRGIASGILQGGYSTGFLLSSLVYQLGYPFVSDNPDRAWRVMLWAGVIPAIVVFFLMTRVSESPLWLEQQRQRAGKTNAHLSQAETAQQCRLEPRDQALLERAVDALQLSARSMHRILRVARTIADLDGSDGIREQHLTEAIAYRRADRGDAAPAT